MADSEVAICNLALLHTGDTKGLIATLEDPSEQAAACKLLYAQTRDELLESFLWPWATRRAYLAQLGGATWATGTTYGIGDYVSYAPNVANVVAMPEKASTFVYVSLVAANLGHQPDTSPTSWRQVSRPEYAFVYQMPDDVIEIVGLYPGTRDPREDEKIPFAIEDEADPGPGTVLLTDGVLAWQDIASATVSVALVYTARITNVRKFSAGFTATLAWRLAEQLALSLRKDPEEAERCSKAGDKVFALAKARALANRQRDPAPTPSHIAARK